MRRFAMSREFFRPKSYTDRFEVPELGIEVYFLEENGPVAKVFGGKRSKPDFYSRYKSAERRQEAVDEYIKREKERAAEKVKERKERKKLKTSLKPGDILYNSWGYDQTNVDFYKVLSIKGQKVTLVEVAQKVAEAEMTYENVLPVADAEISKPFTRMVGEYGFKINSFAYASKWDGKPKHQTAFGYGH